MFHKNFSAFFFLHLNFFFFFFFSYFNNWYIPPVANEEPGSLDVSDEVTIVVYDKRGDSTHTPLGEVSFTVVGDVTVTLTVISPETQEQQAYEVCFFAFVLQMITLYLIT